MKSSISILALALATYSFGGTAFFSGSLTASSPTFNRPTADGLGLSPDVGTAVSYSAQVFSVSATGEYSFETLTSEKDPFTLVYRGGFDPLDPLTNFVDANDDWVFEFELLPADADTDFLRKSKVGDTTGVLGKPLLLDAGVNYFAVTSTYENGLYFNYESAIGPVNGTIGDVTLAPVPEPASMLALAGGVAGLLARRKRK